jgi:hypothetical protein
VLDFSSFILAMSQENLRVEIKRKVAFSALAFLAIVSAAHAACPADHYVNVSGHCVPRPVHSNTVPPGATAHCRDRTWCDTDGRRRPSRPERRRRT